MQKLFQRYTDDQILATGVLTPATLAAYRNGERQARPATIMAVAQALGLDWRQYV